MRANWGKVAPVALDVSPEIQYANARRATLSENFQGDRLIIEAGSLKTRANDTDYRFRPFTEFAYFTCLGVDYEPDAVLVFEPVKVKLPDSKIRTHISTLYIEPMKDRTSEEFYTSASHGEFWVGKRPDLSTFAKMTGLEVKPLSQLAADLKKPILLPHKTRYLRESGSDAKLAQFASEMRLVKDAFEIQELQKAVDATKAGFERVIRKLPEAIGLPRSERIVEGEFLANALFEGNSVGYDTIAASGEHATTLHWIRNNGTLKEGELLLLDAGVEVETLYTADITRTLPLSSSFTPEQRAIYDIVLEAADAAFAAAKPGAKFFDVHNAAMEVIAKRLLELEVIKDTTLDEVLSDKGGQHRRWMVHGTSHHLGLDVHDCAQARTSEYFEGTLKEGMVFTIEPGLYFKSEDELVPKKYRGIGVRIEDNILITADGAKNLSKNIPRTANHVEAWMKRLQGKA